MKQYLLSVYQPEGPPPPAEVMDRVVSELDALNDELKAAGAWVFAAALCPPSTSTVVRTRDGDTLMTDGPFAESKEFVGGFTVIQTADLDSALAWGGKLTAVLGLPIEVRPLYAENAG